MHTKQYNWVFVLTLQQPVLTQCNTPGPLGHPGSGHRPAQLQSALLCHSGSCHCCQAALRLMSIETYSQGTLQDSMSVMELCGQHDMHHTCQRVLQLWPDPWEGPNRLSTLLLNPGAFESHLSCRDWRSYPGTLQQWAEALQSITMSYKWMSILVTAEAAETRGACPV